MKVSVIVPVGDLDAWRTCEASLKATFAAYSGPCEFETLPCFDLEHRGAYAARNEGLRRATGDWVAWVDCDDTVEPAWFPEIAAAVEEHADVDVIQFDATEVSDRGERPLRYRLRGAVAGEAFAHELLRNDGMPAWLWTRVFRRGLFDGASFVGRVDEDYQMFLRILPRIRGVWSIGRSLYRYVRHGHGLSNYVQETDYAESGERHAELIRRLPDAWRHDAWVGLALTMADVALHSRRENGSRGWVRRYGWRVLSDRSVPLRLKVKCLLAMLGARRR